MAPLNINFPMWGVGARWEPLVLQLSFLRLGTDCHCQYVDYLYFSDKQNWVTQNLRLGHMRPKGRGLDIAALNCQ